MSGFREFLVQIEIDTGSTPPDHVEALRGAEAARAAELAAAGHLVALWRIPGRWANYGLWRAPDTARLHELLDSLPLRPHMKVRVEATDLSTFPDVSVVCGEAKSPAIDANAITNPTLLVEVTSRSTEDYDRGDRLSQYKQIPSLHAVVFVSHRAQRLTVVERTATGWDERDYRSGEVMKLGSPDIEIAVDDVYDGITLDPQ